MSSESCQKNIGIYFIFKLNIVKQIFIFLPAVFLISTINSQAQSFAINATGAAAHTSAILDVSSTTKGMLIPRMTTTERNAINSPIAGLIIYNSSTASLENYDGTSWVSLSTGFVPYSGATGPVNLGAYNLTVQSMTIGLGGGNLATNTVMGKDALIANTTGNYNSAYGFNALTGNIGGIANTAIGYRTLFSNTGGVSNTALGVEALYTNVNGSYNVATGREALYSNNYGSGNTANGYQALKLGAGGSNNTATGYQALYNCELGGNTANGYLSLYSNTFGDNNTASGSSSLYTNTTGYWNTASGFESLYFNTTGRSNTVAGYRSMYLNTDGYWNTAFGRESLSQNSTGYYNTAIGMYAGSTITSGYNNVAVGYAANVPDGTLPNQVRIGNGGITYAGVQVAWTITSDRRWKTDIHNSELGLDFINELRPVSYYRNNDDRKRKEFGFIAQEIETTLNKYGATNTGIISKDDKGMYGLRYNDFIAPMVKAIQQLNAKNEAQEKQIAALLLLVQKMAEKKTLEKTQ